MTVDLSRLGSLANQGRQMSRPSARNGDRSWYRIKNEGGKAELWIYDMIGEWGVSAQDFVADLRALGGVDLDLHINSEGGMVFDGIAIYTALKQYAGKITGYIDGLAASAASFIAMACDVLVVAKNARMMIHEASGLCVGNAKDMRQLADLLDDLSENIATIYQDRAGGTTNKWREAMRAETWYSAEDAVKANLADHIDAPPDPEDSPSNQGAAGQVTTGRWDPQQFASLMKGVLGHAG